MGYARKSLICLNDTPYYHVVARCVRRAWLWGFDEYAGKDYSHRKAGARATAGNVFGRALGRLDHLRLHTKALGQSWIKGLRQAERLYRTA